MKNEMPEPVTPQVEPLNRHQLLEQAKSIDPKKIAKTVLKWLINNVESYIDNKETVFLVYFSYDVLSEHGLDELKKLQELYYAIPNEGVEVAGHKVDSAAITDMLDALDAIVDKAKSEMEASTTMMEELFKRIIYYYEMVGYSKLTGPIIKSYKGKVSINHFMYEPVSMPVTVTKKIKKLVNGEAVDTDIPDEIISQFVIPEGYSLEMELIKEMVD